MKTGVGSGDFNTELAVSQSEHYPPPETNVAVAAFAYNAFISYSHAADGTLAPSLRDGLQRFATPWRAFRLANPIRSLRVFQDQASLSANPALWPTIESALASSEWFILLASPEAAASPWVGKEVEFWLRNRTVEKLLIVQTDGDVTWDAVANDFDWARTTALPKQLFGAFQDEPRWTDARFARTEKQATLRDPRFRDLVAELAAPLRDVAKDELIGEDIRQHRRLNFLRNAVSAVLGLLLIGALTAAGLALWQRNLAEEQLAEAQRNQSRALASLANNEAKAGSRASAVRLALAGLPQSLAKPSRRFVPEAEAALWDALKDLQEVRRISVLGSEVRSVAFNLDGTLIAAGTSDNTARIFKVDTGQEIAAFSHNGVVSSVAFSPDSRFIATGSDDGAARLWDLATGRLTARFEHESRVASIAYSPNGRFLAVGSACDAELWDLMSGIKIWTFNDPTSLVKSVSFDPSGELLAVGSDFRKHLLNVKTGQDVSSFHANEGQGSFVTFSPKGEIIASVSGYQGGEVDVDADQAVRLLEAKTGQEIAALSGHEGAIFSVAFSPDGKMLATAGSDRTARLWEIKERREMTALRGNEGSVATVAFSPNGKLLATGGADGVVRLWDVLPRSLHIAVATQEARVTSVSFSPDGRFLATGLADHTARIWEAVTGKEVAVVRVHSGSVTSVAFSPDGRLIATGSEDKTTRLFDVASRKLISAIEVDATVTSVAFSPDGNFIAAGSADKVWLWEVATGQVYVVLRGHDEEVVAVAFSKNGEFLATGSRDKTAGLWKVATGAQIARLRADGGTVDSVAFSPDAEVLATVASQGGARLWDVATGRETATLRVNGTSIALSPDGKYLAIGRGGSVLGSAQLRDVQTRKEITTLRFLLQTAPPTIDRWYASAVALAFSPDGTMLAIAGGRTTQLWPVGQRIIDMACARIGGLPFSEQDNERLGDVHEWCTPEVSAALHVKFGLDRPPKDSAKAGR